MALLMPTTSPRRLTRGPPELPGLIAASVWIALITVLELSAPLALPVRTGRSRALTMPLVTVPCRPSGEPIATTSSPGSRSAERPSVAGVRPSTPCARMTARSVTGSRPTISAAADEPSLNVTRTEPPFAAAATTWLLVRISPSVRQDDAGALTATAARRHRDRDNARQDRGRDLLDRAVGGVGVGGRRGLQRPGAARGRGRRVVVERDRQRSPGASPDEAGGECDRRQEGDAATGTALAPGRCRGRRGGGRQRRTPRVVRVVVARRRLVGGRRAEGRGRVRGEGAGVVAHAVHRAAPGWEDAVSHLGASQDPAGICTKALNTNKGFTGG